ncbi:MAG: hypothetical protein OXG18_04155, partial [Gemmatimonadetes bacterium]|nr:hypothetical protein [Gemmatimonadota bacterium]
APETGSPLEGGRRDPARHVGVRAACKAGVHRASRYEPELNPTYRELAVHYDFWSTRRFVGWPCQRPSTPSLDRALQARGAAVGNVHLCAGEGYEG